MIFIRLGEAWRWMRAGDLARASMRSALIQAALQGDQAQMRRLSTQGLVPHPNLCALAMSIQTWGSRSEPSMLLSTLWPRSFGRGAALGSALAEPDFNPQMARHLLRLLPKSPRQISLDVALGLRKLEEADPDLASSWLERIASRQPTSPPWLARNFGLLGAESLLEQALRLAGSQRPLAQRLALAAFSLARDKQGHMPHLSEPMLRSLVEASSPHEAAKAKTFGAPCAALTRLVDAKLLALPPPASDEQRADWIIQALRSEPSASRHQALIHGVDWIPDAGLLARLRLIAQTATAPILALAATELAKPGIGSDLPTRELLLDVVLCELPLEWARRLMNEALSTQGGPQAAGPWHRARLEAQAFGDALGDGAPARQRRL